MVGWLAQEGGTIEAVFGSSEKTALWVILGISIVALLFAWYLVREVLSASRAPQDARDRPGNWEGAKAYLLRQFRTVAVFPAALAVALFFVLPAPPTPSTPRSRSSSAARSRSSWARVFGHHRTSGCGSPCARTCAPPTPPVSRAAQGDAIAFRAGGVAGMFTVGLGCSAPWPSDHYCDATACWSASPWGRFARDVHAGRRRHLHEGGRRRRRPGRQGRAGIPEMIQQRRGDRRQPATTSGTAPHGGRPVRVVRDHADRVADFRRGGLRRLPKGAIIGVMFPLFVRVGV